ncbi:MAG: FxsA family protein [Solirubrobacterales bacterium]|nr:FxsA family protein [Solirubrobacterales bacterium]MCB0869753.1 FxsA family protein [Solirubrobacterales bacterium]
MFVFILALLIIWPIAELFVMIQVANWVGFFWMLFLLFASAVAGILILQHRGRAHWRRFRGAIDERRPPAKEAFDGVMITAGAMLLIIPGFITSAIGLFLLFPPTRWLVRLVALTLFASKFKVAATTATWGNRGYSYYRGSRRTSYDVEGEAVDVTDRTDGEPLPQLRSGSESSEDQVDRNP